MPDALILQAARFGDLIQTKRLALSLQRDCRLHFVVDKSLSGLAAIIYPDAIIHELFFHEQPSIEKISWNMSVFRELRAINFQHVYNCNFSPLTAEICRLFPLDIISGYRPAINSRGGIDRSPWARLLFRLGAMRRNSPLNLVDFWGNMTHAPIAGQAVNPVAKAGGGGLGIAIAGRESRRSLPPAVLAPIVQLAFQILNGPQIKLFGGKNEQPAARNLLKRFSAAMSAKTVNLCGKTNWQQLVAEMGALDLLITPDTGLMHLAANLGVPVMAFFLSSAWAHETGPYGAGHLIWQSLSSCSPCLESQECPHAVECLKPFADPGFARIMANAMLGKTLPDLPENLQLWRTEFDHTGVFLHLAAGIDPHAKIRTALRQVIANYLNPGLNLPGLLGLPEAERLNLASELFPPLEWMLPPKRYC